MLTFDNGGILVQDPSELPPLPGSIRRLYADYETASDSSSEVSTNPWHHCRPIGLAVTWDAERPAWFVPHAEWSVRWVQDLLARSDAWVNHNVKYDAHVAQNAGIVVPKRLRLVDTVVAAKLVDSDRQFKGGYGLDVLSRDVLREDITQYEEALQPYLYRNKDYGRIPVDVLAEYACQDVLTNRRLDRWQQQAMHEDYLQLWDTEQRLTSVLWRMEQRGMRVVPQKLRIADLVTLAKMVKLEEELATIVGRSFRPNVNEDCFEVLCVQYGLPVLGWTDTGNPSFDKEAIAAYDSHPLSPRPVIERIAAFRKLNTFRNLFVVPFQALHVDGVLHPSYNQRVRTGRMSCKDPNAQQQSKLSKELFVPREGNAFMSADYSQIEFRYMMHYIQDSKVIAAYCENPDADFHQLVADMAGIKRRPAKTVNFMIGFGGGKKKTVKKLSTDKDVVGDVLRQVEHIADEGARKKAFDALCWDRGVKVYEDYHAMLPGIKITSRKAESLARQRGYVRDWYGGHRHLDREHCHIAFNSINQASAAALQKERTVALDEELDGTGIYIDALVHDETLMEGPTEVVRDPRVRRDVAAIMERPARPIRVPVRVSVGVSAESWAAAGADGNTSPVAYDPGEAENFRFLK